MSTPIILPDSEALIQIKYASRKNYLRAFGQLRKFVGEDFSTRAPPEEELLQYFKHLREDKKMASSSLWTTYSMINRMCKGKFTCNLKQYCRCHACRELVPAANSGYARGIAQVS